MSRKKEEFARLGSEQKTKRDNSAINEQLKKDFYAVTLKATGEVDALTTSSALGAKKADDL